jgi:putative transposase
MADENDTGFTADDPATEMPTTPKPKKRRAKRGLKTVAEAVPVSPATTVKSTRAYRKKSTEQAGEVKSTPDAAPANGNSLKNDVRTATAKNKAVGKAGQAQKSIRKALSEKLRAENADLRKRLELK